MKHTHVDYGDDTIRDCSVMCAATHDPLDAQLIITQCTMKHIEEDVEMRSLQEEKENMMREAKLECLIIESEIDVITRWNGDQLQPIFSDVDRMLSYIPPDASLTGTLGGDALNDGNEGCNEVTDTTFSVMTRALWATLRQHMTTGEGHRKVDDLAAGLCWIS